jgi:hypothetical protein
MAEFYSMEDIIKLIAKDNIKRAIEYYGMEGTEDAIKRAYNKMPTLRDFVLECYKEYIINGK